MMIRQFRHLRFSPLVIGLLFAICLAAVFLPSLYTLTLLVVALAAGALLLQPLWFLIALLLLRSNADIYMNTFTFFSGSWYSFNAAGLMNIMACGIGLVLLARRFGRGQRWLPSSPLLWLSAFLLVGALSIPISQDFAASLKTWARTAGFLGIALLTIEAARDEKNRRRILQAITFAALPPLAFGYYQVATGTGYLFPGYSATPFEFRPQGTFAHPAILSSFLIVVICLSLAAYVLKYPLWPRWILLGLAATSMGLLVLTYARTEWAGAAVAIGLIGLLRYRRLLLIGLIIGLVLLLAVPEIQARVSGAKAAESFEWRLNVWNASLKIIQNASWIGAGLDTSPQLINTVLVNVIAPPHNEYFRTLIETGVIGFLVFLALQASLLLQSWRAYRWGKAIRNYCSARNYRSASRQVLGLTLLAITAGGLIICLSDNYFDYASAQWFNWVIVGLVATALPLSPTIEWGEEEKGDEFALLPSRG